MTKSVIIALIYFLVFSGFICNVFSIKLVKLISRLGLRAIQLAKVTWRAHARSWRVSVFRDSSLDLANSWDDLQNALTVGILSATPIPFTHTIYALITYKIEKRLFRKKTLKRFLQYTHLVRDSYSSLSENSFVVSSLPLSHCYTLRKYLYSNTTHTYSKCREWIWAWEVLGICQKKPVKLGDAIGRYCRIRITSEDKIPRSPLIVRAWKVKVYWVD